MSSDFESKRFESCLSVFLSVGGHDVSVFDVFGERETVKFISHNDVLLVNIFFY